VNSTVATLAVLPALRTAARAVTVAADASPGADQVMSLLICGSQSSTKGPVMVRATSSHSPALRSRTGCQKSQPALTWLTTLRPISFSPESTWQLVPA
jgi:hypothetical protein